MRVLIVEDEPHIASYIEDAVRSILGSTLRSLHTSLSLEDAFEWRSKRAIDLCLLDLNLSGEDGFDLLTEALSGPFLTIVISAHTERAIQAFEHGVIDFLPKPFTVDRLRVAIDRVLGRNPQPGRARYLVFRKHNRSHLLPVETIRYLEAERYLVHAHTTDGRVELLEKPLSYLEMVLPEQFVRIHRSRIVNLDHMASFEHVSGNEYRVRLKDGTSLALSRSRYPMLARRLGG